MASPSGDGRPSPSELLPLGVAAGAHTAGSAELLSHGSLDTELQPVALGAGGGAAAPGAEDRWSPAAMLQLAASPPDAAAAKAEPSAAEEDTSDIVARLRQQLQLARRETAELRAKLAKAPLSAEERPLAAPAAASAAAAALPRPAPLSWAAVERAIERVLAAGEAHLDQRQAELRASVAEAAEHHGVPPLLVAAPLGIHGCAPPVWLKRMAQLEASGAPVAVHATYQCVQMKAKRVCVVGHSDGPERINK